MWRVRLTSAFVSQLSLRVSHLICPWHHPSRCRSVEGGSLEQVVPGYFGSLPSPCLLSPRWPRSQFATFDGCTPGTAVTCFNPPPRSFAPAKMRLGLTFVSFVLLQGMGARAGSALWETGAPRIQPPHPVERIEVDAAGYAVNDHAVANLKKRYVSIRPLTGVGLTTTPWPNKIIRYCFRTSAAKENLEDYVRQAIDLWHAAGLDSTYQWVEASPPNFACDSNPDIGNILKIIDTGANGGLSCSVGKTLSPELHINTRNDIGKLDAVINIAHEMGHAWGLHHEHQSPHFWRQAFGGLVPDDGRGFGQYWDCTALNDYASQERSVRREFDRQGLTGPALDQAVRNRMDDLCTSQAAAAHDDFSAKEWLPVANAGYDYQITGPAAYNFYDKESIMLYASGGGGRDRGGTGPPGNGQPLWQNDRREQVLLDADGDRFGFHAMPSVSDVVGIKRLYNDGNAPIRAAVLPNSGRSRLRNMFMRRVQRNAGCI
ncbi:hypothetical protein B0T14DRAFT_531445 [Immersiella caudata]|uniref:Peptidase metallopeptidase domain-containing protein n=1 Tax=Immersiella caudata TaxID=314043 RepID=A0AA39WAJ0_9PEZI|nr:hypothetical protein B0T14DRAFT_531445 [Immersiella caudata]